MLSIHPNARTTPAVRAEIARSAEPTGVLATRYGVSTETIRKWRKRGPEDCQDRSARPHKLPWKASEEERAIVCALRRATGFPLDDLTFVVTHFLPHLNRNAVYRILKAEGLNRLPAASRSRKPHGTFKEYDLGFVHLDVKHLPKLRDRDGVTRKRYLYVAIDRCSRWVHLAVKDDETQTSAVAFLEEAIRAFPFTVTHVLTDRGSCFTADGFEAACRKLNVAHRTTALHAAHKRYGGALQRACAARGARDDDLQPPRSRDPAARLQPRLQCPAPAGARRGLAGHGDATTHGGQTSVGQQALRASVRPLRPLESPPHRPNRQGRLASRQLGLLQCR